MIARAYTPSDLEAVKGLCVGSDIDAVRDVIVVVETGSRLVGVMAFGEIAFVHSFAVAGGPLQRMVAELALGYALGVGRAMGHREALFVTDPENTRMGSFIEGKGAKEQQGLVYTMEVR